MLIRKIEQFLATHDMPATKFGRLAAHDPRFVLDLRMGRIPRPETEARTLAWMRDYAQQRGNAALAPVAPPAPVAPFASVAPVAAQEMADVG